MPKDNYNGELHEECAVFGIYGNDGLDMGQIAHHALFAMQHRGQDGAGIAGAVGSDITLYKNTGLVNEVFTPEMLEDLAGCQAVIGHTRYATSSNRNSVLDTQPLVMHGLGGFIAMAHNGHIINVNSIRQTLMRDGMLFQTEVDSEALMHLIARHPVGFEDSIRTMMEEVIGSYAIVLLTPGRLMGIRDPWGIRPLAIGKLGNSYVLASESCAFNAIGAKFIRDVMPGELVIIDKSGLSSIQYPRRDKGSLCVFEYVYIARNDSVIDSVGVFDSRFRMGGLLSEVAPVDADIVAGVPDSALPAAMGYAAQSGIPYGQALIKNNYSGRTFIQGGQQNREQSVKLKLSPISGNVAGKRIVLVDDSIVRGTNCMYIVRMLRRAGAKEVHMRIASPPVMHPCYYGINTPTADKLAAAHMGVDELCRLIEADSLAYLGQEDLERAVDNKTTGLCTACFSGKYPCL